MHLFRLPALSAWMHFDRSTFWNLGTQLARERRSTFNSFFCFQQPRLYTRSHLLTQGTDRQTDRHSHQKPRISSEPNRLSNAPWRRSTTCSSCPAPPLNSCELPRLTLEPITMRGDRMEQMLPELQDLQEKKLFTPVRSPSLSCLAQESDADLSFVGRFRRTRSARSSSAELSLSELSFDVWPERRTFSATPPMSSTWTPSARCA